MFRANDKCIMCMGGKNETMEFIQTVSGKNADTNNLNIGDILSLWDIARNKIIGLSTLSIYYRQARDKDLKDLLKNGIDLLLPKHVNRIQKILKSKGYDFPEEQNWEKKIDDDSPFVMSSALIDDEEIAMSIREIIRLTLSLEAEAVRKTTDPDIINLSVAMLDDDNRSYTAILAMQKKKGWKDYPPNLLS